MNLNVLLDSMPHWAVSVLINVAGAHNRLSRYSRAMRQQMAIWEKMERLPREELERIQLAELRKVLLVAFETPYYRKIMQSERISPDKISSLSDLKYFPVLTRADVEKNFHDLIVPGCRKRYLDRRSSGTTGRPLVYRQPRELVYIKIYAMLYQFYTWHEFKLFDKKATLGGRYLGKKPHGTCYQNYFENQLLLGVHSLESSNVSQYASALANYRPRLLQGHPSAINLLAELARDKNIALPRVPLISTTGENLSEEQRVSIGEAFNAKVFGTYGLGEACLAGSECTAFDGYHMHPAFGITELVDTGLTGREIVATSLQNDIMPLIRYKTGDLANDLSHDLCKCGRSWPKLKGLLGRVDDIITSATGQKIIPVTLRTDVAGRFKSLPPYTIIQNIEPGSYTLRVFSEGDAERYGPLVGYLEERFGPSSTVNVDVRPVSEFLSNKGKHKIVERKIG